MHYEPSSTAFHHRLVEFVHCLRGSGVPVDSSQLVTLGRAMRYVDVGNMAAFRLAARATLVGRSEVLATFDEVFERYWRNRDCDVVLNRDDLLRNSVVRVSQADRESVEQGNLATQRTVVEASRIDFVSEINLVDNDVPNAIDLAATCEYLVQEIAVRVRRRHRHARRARRIDFRNEMKRFARGQDLHAPAFRRRNKHPRPLHILLDVSGSMKKYCMPLVHLAARLEDLLPQVSVWAFSSRVTRLQSCDGPAWLEQIDHWASGTRLGSCITEFINSDEFAGQGHKSAVMIVSDGWETGDTTDLGSAMQVLHENSRQVIWLNPLKGYASYQPLCAGMQAALPHVDLFLPAHTLKALCHALQRVLVSE